MASKQGKKARAVVTADVESARLQRLFRVYTVLDHPADTPTALAFKQAALAVKPALVGKQ